MLNRAQHLPLQTIEHLHLAPLQEVRLAGGVPLYYLHQADLDVLRIDFMVSAGKWNQTKALVSSLTNVMLKEGTYSKTGAAIAEDLDYCGSWLSYSSGFHRSYLSVYCLSKYFEPTVDLLLQLFYEPSFPDDAFNTVRNKYKEKKKLRAEKVSFLAKKAFRSTLFGTSHPYGRLAAPTDVDQLTGEDLQAFHQANYTTNNLSILLSGKVTEAMIKYLDIRLASFQKPTITTPRQELLSIEPVHFQAQRLWVKKEGALQNAVMIGCPSIKSIHPDFPKFRFVNTLLGGYFGSRLMSNIREDKGYTYHISSRFVQLQYAPYFVIATQTAKEHTTKLIDECYAEIEKLQTDLVSTDELEKVRNYLLAKRARSIDGVFSLMNVYTTLLSMDTDANYIYKEVQALKEITAEEVRALAQQYFPSRSMLEVIAGEPVSEAN